MMNWKELISSKRLGLEEMHSPKRDERTEFQRDYDRLIFSAPFRRLQNKTQVFPLPGSIFVHNRLTHSLEVSSVGRSLGNELAKKIVEIHPELKESQIAEIGAIISAACLAHDLGNPPFGHSGEKAIATFFSEGSGRWLKDYIDPKTNDKLTDEQWSDLINFEGNANSFRLLTHQFCGRRPGGFVMTYSTLASIVKYPFSSSLTEQKGKFGFFCEAQNDYRKIARELGLICKLDNGKQLHYARHPLVYLVEAADDICYQIMDIEDAHKLKILTTNETTELLLAFFDESELPRIKKVFDSVADINERIVYLRSRVIGCLTDECVRAFIAHETEIMAGLFEGNLIQYIAKTPAKAYQQCAALSIKKIYRSKEVVDIELAGFHVITALLESMIEAITHPEKTYSRLLINRVADQYDIRSTSLYGRIMAILDYVSGMTDIYALDLYRKIHGISIPHV